MQYASSTTRPRDASDAAGHWSGNAGSRISLTKVCVPGYMSPRLDGPAEPHSCQSLLLRDTHYVYTETPTFTSTLDAEIQ